MAAADEVGEPLFAPAFDAIRKSNHRTVSEESLNEAFADCWRHPLDWVASKYGFSKEMLAAGWEVFITLEVTHPMHGYSDLASLSELSTLRFLVTSGFRRLQKSKIRALALGQLFTAIHIDAIDEPDRKGKQGFFKLILGDYHLTPAEVLVAGDNADSEIAVGNLLGMKTVQTLRPGVPHSSDATFHINSLTELEKLLSRHKNNEA